MRKFILTSMAAILVAFTASGAYADLFSVAADVPIIYTFSDEGLEDESVSGLKLGVSFPFFLGIALETYEVTGKASATAAPAGLTAASEYSYDVTMVDVYADLPFPFVNLTLGLGAGKGTFSETGSTTLFEDATLFQYFVSIGIPFLVLFDAHVGYQVISGESSVSFTQNAVNLDASMATVGLKVGF